ncbi:MAG: ATP-binding cassette domain-containing protein, partial [Candidatus Hydrogenedentes bacterium]|nr:ATP-binding cassette domain-containing protein [Candidatus Hydrogenedentota bacterium]
MIEVKNLCKTYSGRGNKVVALENVSMAVKAGEFVAVQGPSGCGKTTLLLSVGALLMPTSGSVSVDGKNPYGLSSEMRARFRGTTIGFVFQQFHLVP